MPMVVPMDDTVLILLLLLILFCLGLLVYF